MTRLMTGPPEKYQLLGPMVIVWEGGNGYYYHPSLMDDKCLSDAECAAEYWRARADSWAYELMHLSNWFGWPDDAEVVADPSPDDVSRWDDITHRFATRPHAVKETPNE